MKKARNSTTQTPTASRFMAAGSATYCRNAAMSRAAWSNSRASIRPGVASSSFSTWASAPWPSPYTGRWMPCSSHSAFGIDTPGNSVLFQPIGRVSST